MLAQGLQPARHRRAQLDAAAARSALPAQRAPLAQSSQATHQRRQRTVGERDVDHIREVIEQDARQRLRELARRCVTGQQPHPIAPDQEVLPLGSLA